MVKVFPSIEGGFIFPVLENMPSHDDIYLLARLVYSEARGEPFTGQVAVAAVLLNRVKSDEFPDSIFECVYQPNQFEPVANGQINQVPNNDAYEAVLMALRGTDPTNGAVFFWNPDKVSAMSWVWTRTVTSRIGDHVFA